MNILKNLQEKMDIMGVETEFQGRYGNCKTEPNENLRTQKCNIATEKFFRWALYTHKESMT